jgi:hypothetical protein
MEPIQQINNANGIANIKNNANQIPNIGVRGPSVIPTINPPVSKSIEVPVVRGLEVPVIDVPNTTIKYPVINVPTQAEFDAAVNAERQKQAQEQQEKPRGLPDTTQITPQVNQAAQPITPPVTTAEIPADKPQPSFTVLGTNINLPDPSIVATAGAVAVVTTATTMVSGIALNMVKNAAEPLLREAVKNKFKIKLKQVKPVLHYVMTDTGHVDIFEYSVDGTKLVDTTDNVENYIRAQVETNAFYETENKIIIDDVVEKNFTKEGQKRFKPLFAPAKKIAKKLSARLSF